MGYPARAERGDIPRGARQLRPEGQNAIPYQPEIAAMANFPIDMPPGCRANVWPTEGWGVSTRRGLVNTNDRITDDDAGIQDMMYVVLCEEEVPMGEVNRYNDPDGIIRACHDPSEDGHDKWDQAHRFYDGYELFDTKTPLRKGGDETMTLGHREGNDTMRIFYRGALMGLMIEKLRSMLYETMIIFIRNSLPDMKVYLLQNIENIRTIDEAVKWSEHFEVSHTKMSTLKVSSLGPQEGIEEVGEWEDEGGEDTYEIDAFGQRTGGNLNRRRYLRGGGRGGTERFRRIQDVGFRGPSVSVNDQLSGIDRSNRGNRPSGVSQFGPPSAGRNQTQGPQGNCHGCGERGHYVRDCPRISSSNGNNRSYGGGFFGGRFQSYRGGPPKGGRWIKIRRDFGNGKPNAISAVEDVEEELVWQEDEGEEYVEALEEEFQPQQISVVERITNQDNTIENEQHYVPYVTM